MEEDKEDREIAEERALPKIREPVDTHNGQVLLRVIATRDLIDIMVPPTSSQKGPLMGERFRPGRVHRWLSSVGIVDLTRPRSKRPVPGIKLEFIRSQWDPGGHTPIIISLTVEPGASSEITIAGIAR